MSAGGRSDQEGRNDRPRAPSPRLGPGGEFDLIRRFLRRATPAATPGVLIGPGDDAAVLRNGVALSTDMSVENVHFRREWMTPREIGYRAAAGALSDLAAMAARPIGALVSLALPEDDAGDFAEELMAGVQFAVEGFGAAVIGGDLTRTGGPVVVDLTVVGDAKEPVLRSTAQAGDELWVTGALGGASLAVQELSAGRGPPEEADRAFRSPAPRIREAIWLRDRELPYAMIDLSDGLAGDAAHMAAASGVALVLEREAIPISSAVLQAARERGEALRHAVAGGEDYELLMAAPAGLVEPHRESFTAEFGIALTRVGRVAEGEGVFWATERGREPLALTGYRHFHSSG